MSWKKLKDFLDEKVKIYNQSFFIEYDPIQIPHLFLKKEDIEISGFLTAVLSWGNRKTILKKAKELINSMDKAPHEFILYHSSTDLNFFKSFKHRTFNFTDLSYFFKSLREIYKKYKSLEKLFEILPNENFPNKAITRFRKIFFSLVHQNRTQKHISNPNQGSACKRLHLFLRWMVRKDTSGVDLGIWKSISASKLSIPLDLHSANTARSIGLLSRKQNDLKAVFELDEKLRYFDEKDPLKYDFALFGLGALKNI